MSVCNIIMGYKGNALYCKAQFSFVLGVLFAAVQVNTVVFSPDEKHFATCSEDGSVRVWSVSSTELVVQFQVLSQVRECTNV